MKNEILKKIAQIKTSETSVRDFINTTRYQDDLLKNLDTWNQICSSLDTIGDTLCTFEDYLIGEYPKSDGLKYIYTYGILQALFIQQDAMKNLSEAFDIKFDLSEQLTSIRNIRNASIGHPTKNSVKGSVYFNYISRMTMSREGFTLMRSYQQGKTEFKDVDLISILNEQLSDIQISYDLLAKKLIEEDKKHRGNFMNNLLVDIFHSGMNYSFQKVSEGIYTSRSRPLSSGILQSIEKTYQKFEEALCERKELNDYILYDLNEYKHAISKIQDYLSNEDSEIKEVDARIYLFYIREQHKHFIQIAKEIDEEYKQIS